MPGTDAERSRRYRRHRCGDHSLCVAGRCPAVDADPAPQAPTRADTVADLGVSGSRLWRETTGDSPPGPLQAALLLEACRIVDRLELLHRQLAGESWLRFRHDESGAEVTVYVDRVLAEAREQATALKGLVVELRQSMGKPAAKPVKAGGGVADLTARLAAKRSPAS